MTRPLKKQNSAVKSVPWPVSEYSLIGAAGSKGLKTLLNEALASGKITPVSREEVALFLAKWMVLSEQIKRIENKINAYAGQQEKCQRLMSIVLPLPLTSKAEHFLKSVNIA